ncbi:MAG TPA: prenyltransferase [Thermoplasmata archaeon]|nr:prenyltransferase [Thermoplasmata archaeon]
MKRLKALWDLMRLEHGVMLLLAILIGSLIVSHGIPRDTSKLVFSFLTALFLEASTFALNDYMDFEIDKKNNRFDRPLVRGDIQPKSAVMLFSFLFPLGIFFSFLVNWQCFGIALLTGVFAVTYDVKLKKTKILGNLYIAYIMAVPFVFGAVAISSDIPLIILILASIAFLAGWGREIMKDVMDVPGDQEQGVKSLPMYVGKGNAYRIVAFFYLAAVALSFFPYFLLNGTSYHGNMVYLALILLTDTLFLLIVCDLIVKSNPPVGRYRKLTLVAMVFGLLAFLGGAFLQG